MDLWHGSLSDFVRRARAGAIAGDLAGSFVHTHRVPPSPSELRSWENSLGALADALADASSLGIGVSLLAAPGVRGVATGSAPGAMTSADAQAGEAGVALEYHLPLSGRRLDAMFFGHDACDTGRTVVLELKQWSTVDLEDEHAINVLVGGEEHPHPSRQALDYAEWMTEYHSAFAEGALACGAASYLHEMRPASRRPLFDLRFADLLNLSPCFTKGDEKDLVGHLAQRVGHGDGLRVMERVLGGRFRPSARVIEALEAVIRQREEWHLIGSQRIAYDAILAEVRRAMARRGRSAVLVRGGPGTGKTVIAVQLLAAAAQLGFRAVHSTGGKAFTTALRSTFRGAKDLFVWNVNLRNEPSQSVDLLLVDEAHRVRRTSDLRWTPRAERNQRPQVQELMDAAKVTVFLLDENQFVRPDEIGSTELVVTAARDLRVPLRSYVLQEQFRCGGCAEYVAWVDCLLGFSKDSRRPWGSQYRIQLVDGPADLDRMLATAGQEGASTRVVAGFCWRWSDPLPDGSLVPDVAIGSWRRPWNAKRLQKKHYTPATDPYTLWATTDVGLSQIGCVYSVQGFEFERVGVIWGEDLVWRKDRWVAQPGACHDRPVKSSPAMEKLVRNAYRVLLTRGMHETHLLVLDGETRAHVRQELEGMQ
jgi:hypothetical protein